MAFSNPIVGGGGALVRSSIHSPDYVAGVSGWTINRDGSAEFNNGTYRGEIIIGTAGGQRVEVLPTGEIDIYNSSNVKVMQLDGQGLQVLSTAGNVYIFNGTQPQINMGPTSDGGNTFDTASLIAFETGTPHYQGVLEIFPPELNVFGTTSSQLLLLAQSADGGSNYQESTAHFEAFGDSFIFQAAGVIGEGLYVDVKTKKSIYQYTGSAKEDWHALTLQNGWTNRGGSDVTAQYRKIASPPNTVEIVGYIASGTVTDGTVLFTLPVGYRPAHNVVFPVYTANVTAGRTALLTAKTDGTCTITFLSGATSVGFHCLIPLDA